jgi:predicted Zn-dependent protease
MFEILGIGSTPAEEDAVVRSARSLRPVTDPARLTVKPDRVRVVSASATGPLSEVLPRLGPQALGAEETAVLNNLELDETVRTGEALKVVRPGRPR